GRGLILYVSTPDHARQFVTACRTFRINDRPFWGTGAAALRRYAKERENMALREECLGRTENAEIEREIARIFKEGAAELQALQDERIATWERERERERAESEENARVLYEKHKGKLS